MRRCDYCLIDQHKTLGALLDFRPTFLAPEQDRRDVLHTVAPRLGGGPIRGRRLRHFRPTRQHLVRRHRNPDSRVCRTAGSIGTRERRHGPTVVLSACARISDMCHCRFDSVFASPASCRLGVSGPHPRRWTPLRPHSRTNNPCTPDGKRRAEEGTVGTTVSFRQCLCISGFLPPWSVWTVSTPLDATQTTLTHKQPMCSRRQETGRRRHCWDNSGTNVPLSFRQCFPQPC